MKKVLFSLIILTVISTFSVVLASDENYIEHIVIENESLWKISQKYDVSINDIMTANELENTDIMLGQSLHIPINKPDDTFIYIVKDGDTLWKIASKYDTDIQNITAINSIDTNSQLLVGQILYIPQKVVPSNSYDTVHVVQSGDTLWKIADKYDITIQDIININNIDINDSLVIGQKIYIPSSPNDSNGDSIYIVQSGDTVWKISVKFNVDIKDILKANNLTETSVIYKGQKLSIPNLKNKSCESEPYITYTEYAVEKGDTLWSISIKHGVPMSELADINNFSDTGTLYIGQKITVPIHHVPVISTPGPIYGEYLDWWTQAQYVFPIGARAKVTDFKTGKSYNIIRSYGAFHADCEPLTVQDSKIMYKIWGNMWSWIPRASIVEYNGRKIAASVSNMPHNIQDINNNEFEGHFDIHFLNSRRHKDNLISEDHQEQIKIAAGIDKK